MYAGVVCLLFMRFVWGFFVGLFARYDWLVVIFFFG